MKPIPFNVVAKIFGSYHRSQNLVHGVAIDSRLVHPGDLFFALKGERVDGHDFLFEAEKRGAIGAVVEKGRGTGGSGLPVLEVNNVLAHLQQLAKEVLAKRSCKVVAITGSVGKTTTKEFLATLLSSCYKVAKSPLSYNAQATVPLSILRASGKEDILILEMGMSEPGQIKKLIDIAPPDVAVLTPVVLQHASAFPEGLKAIAQEKGTLFSAPTTTLGFYPTSFPLKEDLLNKTPYPLFSYSLDDEGADGVLAIEGDDVKIALKDEPPFPLKLSLPSSIYYENFLVAALVARKAFGLSWYEIKRAATKLALPPSRFQQVIKEGIHFIDDAYNANAASVLAVLNALPNPKKGGRKIAILGEMNDLGSFSEGEHKRVANQALRAVDLLFCVGKRAKVMQDVWEENGKTAYYFEYKEALQEEIKKHVKKGDVVLVKGSRALELDKIVRHFS